MSRSVDEKIEEQSLSTLELLHSLSGQALAGALRKIGQAALTHWIPQWNELVIRLRGHAANRIGGTPLEDLLLMGDVNADAEEHLAAAERLADNWFSWPIPPQRWERIAPVMRERAEAEGRPPEMALRDSVITALFLVMSHCDGPMKPFPGSDDELQLTVEKYVRWLRAQVANAVCEDFLGPDWRREGQLSVEDPPLETDILTTEPEVTMRFLVEELKRQAHLTEREAEVVLLKALGYQGPQIGEALGVDPSTARVHLHKARKKAART